MGAMPSVESPDSRASVDQAAPVTPATGERCSGRPFWREPLAPYARAHLGRAMLDVATAVVPYVALSVLMYLALSVSYLLVLAIAVPAAGFLLRFFETNRLTPFAVYCCVVGAALSVGFALS